MADVRSVGRVVALMHFGGGGEGSRATGGEPSPSLASAASRRVGPCTRSVVQRSCTGGPGAASASVTLGRGADGEWSGPFSGLPRGVDSEGCGAPAGLSRAVGLAVVRESRRLRGSESGGWIVVSYNE